MSALGLGVLFVIIFTLGIAWLIWALDVRMARGRQVCQLPFPLDDLGYAHGPKLQSGLQPLRVMAGSMLVFFAAMGAVFVGKLATMQPDDAAAVFQAYPLLQSRSPVLPWLCRVLVASRRGLVRLGADPDAICHPNWQQVYLGLRCL